MDLSLEQYERIQRYLDDKMTSEEEKDFMNNVEEDDVLREAIQFEIELRQNLQLLSANKKQPDVNVHHEKEFEDAHYILSLVQNAGKEWQEENKKKSSSAKPVAKIISFPFSLSVAAAACLLMVVTVAILYMSDTRSPQSTLSKNKNTDSLEKMYDSKTEILVVKPHDSLNNSPSLQTTVNVARLYQQFYKKDNTPDEMQTPDLLAEELRDYENDKYKTLQNFDLNDITLRGETDDINNEQNIKEIGHYYKGLAFLQSNNIKQASDNLQWVITNAKNKQLVVKAQWYQALCYLQQGNINNAVALLTSVSSKKVAPYDKQADKLLQKLLNQ